MGIADIRSKVAPVRKGPPCEACQLLATVSDEEADTLRGLLADPTIRYTTLADALRDDPDTDIDISAYTLSRHARGGCGARERLR